MMLGFDPTSTPPPGVNPNSNPFGGPNPFAGFPGMEGMNSPSGPGGADDPMLKMLQQMMGGIPGEGAGGMPSFPGMPDVPGQSTAIGDPYAYVWRIVHAVFSLSLGLYIAFMTPFTGSRVARERSGLVSGPGGFEKEDIGMGLRDASVHFFWIFATAEVLLQTSRFFMEKGRVQQGGIMGMVMGFLPEPWKGYLGLISRYSRIWTTVSGDAMVCVFVLGVCAWLRGS
jgi:GET complex subunit GET2